MLRYDLCVITRPQDERGRGHLEIALAALRGGATIIQLRDKTLSTRALLALAETLLTHCRRHGAALIINDRVDIALASGADGVHLGDDDMPLPVARRLLGPDAVLGASVGNLAAAQAAAKQGATYLGLGPIFPTGSKADAGEAIGLPPLGEIRRVVGLPILAIGGLTCDNGASVVQAGADGVAVISAVADADDMEAATRELLERIRAARRPPAAGAQHP